MIQSVSAFVHYFESIRRRTLKYIHALPGDQMDWSPLPNEFTCADIIRHLAATEQMYVEAVVDGRWHYPGHSAQPDDHLEAIILRFESTHIAAMQKLSSTSDAALYESHPSFLPNTPPVKTWRWLMAMVEHEVHHRSQLATYLTLMGIEPPQIYDVGVETLMELPKE